jgi:hypothetical protein
MAKQPEKLTLVADTEMCDALREWALEDGKRPVTSLLRKIVAKALAERRQHDEAAA